MLKCCGNVAATLWQRLDNVGVTLSQRRKPTSAQLSFSTVPQRCDNVNKTRLGFKIVFGCIKTILTVQQSSSFKQFSIKKNT